MTRPQTLTAADARAALVAHHALRADLSALGEVLGRLRMIQLDPLDRIGTNADLVCLARLDAAPGVEARLLDGAAFEHFAKERCILPAEAWPYARERARDPARWRLTARMRALDEALCEAVREEVAERGPLTSRELSDRGQLPAPQNPVWKGSSKAATLALRALCNRCELVVCGRRGRDKLVDIPARALPAVHDLPATEPYAAWSLRERAEAAGMLPTISGPWWGMMTEVRRGPTPEALLAAGQLELLQPAGSRRSYLAPAGWRDRPAPEDDGRMRILGPLDPLLWDRKLIAWAFGFDYLWEVYKPAAQRRWGYYVCPLLHRGALVGRVEGRLERGPRRLTILKLWRDDPSFDDEAFEACWARHEAALCGAAPDPEPRKDRA